MKKFLVFVEDPGVTNMILDFPKLFSSLNAEFQIIANSYAADILSNKKIYVFFKLFTFNLFV